MSQCPECQYAVNSEDEFCENCGHRLRSGGADRAPSDRSEQTPPISVRESPYPLPRAVGSWKTLRWIFGLPLGLFLCCGLLWASGIIVAEEKPERIVYQVVTATSTPTPTNTPGPSPTPTVTNTPTSTSTPTFTPTPTSTFTPIPTTVSGTILEPGQTWCENDLCLRMELIAIQPDGIVFDLILENIGNDTILFESRPEMYRMITNLNQIVGPKLNSYGQFAYGSGFRGGLLEIRPGESHIMAMNSAFRHNLANADVTEVVVDVSGLSRIERAQWRVKIPH